MIIQERVQEMRRITSLTGYSKKFNCWGATQYALGHRTRYGWVGESVMSRWLNTKTVLVEDDSLEVGDILVITCDKRNFLIHTAVYMGNSMWFHKIGKEKATYESKAIVIERYSHRRFYWGGGKAKVELRRVKPKKKKAVI